VQISVPNFGTYSAYGDPTHKFLTDLNHWNIMFRGFFNSVVVDPYGIRYESVSEKWIQYQFDLIKDGFWDLAQGFNFVCREKKDEWTLEYVPWFLEEEISEI